MLAATCDNSALVRGSALRWLDWAVAEALDWLLFSLLPPLVEASIGATADTRRALHLWRLFASIISCSAFAKAAIIAPVPEMLLPVLEQEFPANVATKWPAYPCTIWEQLAWVPSSVTEESKTVISDHLK